MTDIVVALTTVPGRELGERIARALVDGGQAACVSLCAPMTSFYRWQGRIEQAEEWQLVIKTSRDRVAAVEATLRALHSYELPEFLVLPAVDGSREYLDWVRTASAGSDTASTR